MRTAAPGPAPDPLAAEEPSSSRAPVSSEALCKVLSNACFNSVVVGAGSVWSFLGGDPFIASFTHHKTIVVARGSFAQQHGRLTFTLGQPVAFELFVGMLARMQFVLDLCREVACPERGMLPSLRLSRWPTTWVSFQEAIHAQLHSKRII